MKVAVLSEIDAHENRVALTPDSVRELVHKRGLTVAVERGAGTSSHFLDGAYQEAGADIVEGPAAALDGATIALKVQPPTDDEIASLPSGIVLFSMLSPLTDPERVGRLAGAGVSAFALELIPRITRAQSMDVLSSQATVAGYKAVLMGANELGKLLPMLMTAAGTIRPGKILVLGAGVAGLQAIATARRLGARVEAFDVRPAVREQVESLGATFLEADQEVSGEGEGGYAKELSDEQHKRELELIAKHVTGADIVVTTAQIPGRPAPLLITEEMVDSMPHGSVIVDLASESGGNCAVTRMGETVVHSGVKVIGPINLPSALPVHASQMFSKNVATLLKEVVEDGDLALDFEDEVVSATCVTHDGEVRHGPTREKLGLG